MLQFSFTMRVMGQKAKMKYARFFCNTSQKTWGQWNILHIFSDGCRAQNKNHTLVKFCSALVSLGKFENIDQYFPIRGHSFLPYDRDFAVIKRKIKTVDHIFTLDEYPSLIRSSTKNDRFKVLIMDASSILDFKSWWPKHYKKMMLSVESSGRNVPKNEKFTLKISQFMHFSHSDISTLASSSQKPLSIVCNSTLSD